MNSMTKEQFNEFIFETVPCALFHVMPTDFDENGVRCDEKILIDLLHGHPQALKHKSLSWFVWYFIEKEAYPLMDDEELKRLIWEEWEGEIKEEDPRKMVFKYMKMMRDLFINNRVKP